MARPLKVYTQPKNSSALTPSKLGQFVRAKRTQAGLRIDDAAQLCGVTTETLSRIETAKSTVQLTSLFKVMNGLGIELMVVPWDEGSENL